MSVIPDEDTLILTRANFEKFIIVGEGSFIIPDFWLVDKPSFQSEKREDKVNCCCQILFYVLLVDCCKDEIVSLGHKITLLFYLIRKTLTLTDSCGAEEQHLENVMMTLHFLLIITSTSITYKWQSFLDLLHLKSSYFVEQGKIDQNSLFELAFEQNQFCFKNNHVSLYTTIIFYSPLTNNNKRKRGDWERETHH